MRIAALVLGMAFAGGTATAAEITSAAVNAGRGDVTFEVEGNPPLTVEYSRIGLEFWERMVGEVEIGLELGYSESTRRDGSGQVTRGNYGGLALRYRPRFGERFGIDSLLSWRVQDDEATLDSGGEKEIRIYETAARIAPEIHFGPFALAVGASWRRIEYREREDDGGSLLIDVSEDAQVVPFAALSLRTDDEGMVRFEYVDAEQSGWRVQFAKGF